METRVYQNPEPPAFFQAAKKPFQVIPQNDPLTNRVEFLVIGEGIDNALQELYANTPVGVLDFIKELQVTRGRSCLRCSELSFPNGEQKGSLSWNTKSPISSAREIRWPKERFV
jgi:hypothetical protein